ncbi:sensor domain-containing diguanylate cyclase [Undibacterium parvum]|uniref:Sensor domain-containing diguanylate cyclase n=1 Tax=Undibacterium parvum TaxID=401471 RepID=A0A3Q9BPA7_9BURK|nr:sensor domain-containing diguanylate cyclase [Undibacterium parvum]AZP11305.1 sensor domain-containing diguanylate cyclase [Undibacterium parvum]
MNHTAAVKNTFSLRTILIVPYVALVLVLASAIGWLSYRAGDSAVLTVSDHLLLETAERIGQAIDRHLVGSGATLEAAFPNGMLAQADIDKDLVNLRSRFWIATSLHIDPNNYVYYGNTAGQAIGLYRHSLEEGELRIKTKPEENRIRYRFKGIDGPLQFHSKEEKLFDPRSRPWYTAGANAKNDTWTSVYIDFGTQDLVATRARKVSAANGKLAGVVATDMSLRSLNDFVRNLKMSQHGLAFIIEPNGDLIAASSGPNVQHSKDGSNVRINAKDSGNPFLSAIYLKLLAMDIAQESRGNAKTFSFEDAADERIHVAYQKVKDNTGLEWITVVAVPSKDFMGDVLQNIRRTALISALAALLAILIGLKILNWVATDLQRLSQAAVQVGNGLIDAPLEILRNDEIGVLANSFRTMQLRLQTDKLTGLKNRDAFERGLNAKISQYHASDKKQAFGVMFIDLNGFKAINDQYGHDAGDFALIEVARRLSNSVRNGDVVARYAGDEFVIMLNDIAQREGYAIIRQHIEAAMAQPLKLANLADAPEVQLGGAIGISHFPEDGIDAVALLKVADRNMYVQKFAAKAV